MGKILYSEDKFQQGGQVVTIDLEPDIGLFWALAKAKIKRTKLRLSFTITHPLSEDKDSEDKD